MSSIRRLIDFADVKNREELGEYYIMSKPRIDNLVSCFDQAAERIKELTKIIDDQQQEIKKLEIELCKIEQQTKTEKE